MAACDHREESAIVENDYDEGEPGVLTLQSIDMSDWVGETVRLRLYQHTIVEENGFFTVFDDICHGDGEAADLLTWGAPDPVLAVRDRD